jgi:hypothetical protein
MLSRSARTRQVSEGDERCPKGANAASTIINSRERTVVDLMRLRSRVGRDVARGISSSTQTHFTNRTMGGEGPAGASGTPSALTGDTAHAYFLILPFFTGPYFLCAAASHFVRLPLL